jgi:hypothetical protein
LASVVCDAVLVCDVAFLDWWRDEGARLGIDLPMRMIGLPPGTDIASPEEEG